MKTDLNGGITNLTLRITAAAAAVISCGLVGDEAYRTVAVPHVKD